MHTDSHLKEDIKPRGIFKELQIVQNYHYVRKKNGCIIRVEVRYWQVLTAEGTKSLESVHKEMRHF